MACRIRRTAEWTKRILDEAEGKPSCFLTLTYNVENIPSDLSLKKADLQKFFKRFRFHLKKQKIKYFACGEYGDKSSLPHYHMIIVGWKPPLEDLKFINKNVMSSRIIEKIWPFGFNTAGTVTKESCQYVTGYIRKKLYGKEDHYYPREKPFQLSSQNFGFEYAEKYWKRILKGETVNGKNLGIPRYYIRKLGTTEDIEMLTDLQLAKEARMLENYLTYEDFLKDKNLDMLRRDAEAHSKEKVFMKSKI